MNRKAFNRINYGLFIVAAAADGKRNGCIVNSLHQVTSSSPYKFSLTVNKSNETFKTIEAAGSFAATVLAKDTPKDLVDLFGYKSGRVVDKFEGFDVQTDEAGNPYVKDHALARKVIGDDDVVDQLFVVTKTRLIDFIAKDSTQGEYYLDLLMIAKYLERIADHATNIAEWVLFSITGRHET